MDTREVEEQQNKSEPSDQMLKYLDNVRVRAVAEKVYQTLAQKGVMSIAHLTHEHPLQAGA